MSNIEPGPDGHGTPADGDQTTDGAPIDSLLPQAGPVAGSPPPIDEPSVFEGTADSPPLEVADYPAMQAAHDPAPPDGDEPEVAIFDERGDDGFATQEASAQAEPEAGGAPGPGEQSALADAMQSLERRLLAAFESRLAYDAVKEKQIDRLHEELVDHRRDLLEKIARPLVQGMVRLHDDMSRAVEAFKAKDPGSLTPERFFKLIDGFAEDLEIVLSDHGVETFREAGPGFNPRRQTVSRKQQTDDPARIGQVARSVRPGFERADRILQKERVEVFVPAPAEPT